MTVVAVTNQKGGCGKTTTAVNLAAALGELGFTVLVIDLDPQCNASQWISANDQAQGVYELIIDQSSFHLDLVSATTCPGVDLVHGSKKLARLEQHLAGQIAAEGVLKRSLRAFLASAGRWDFILIDTPPTLGLGTINAMVAADYLLIPVTTHVMTLSGVAQIFRAVGEIRELLNPDLRILGLLPSRVDLRTRHSREVLASLDEHFGSEVMKTNIHECIKLAEAYSFKKSVLGYKSDSAATRDFRSLAKEVVARIDAQ